MIIDSSELSESDSLKADFCIIGSGPASLTLAKELDGKDVRVIMIESGGLEFDAATQLLCDGPTGDPPDPYRLRSRQFCGTSNQWGSDLGNGELGVRYVPLDAIDFERRDWLPYSGWPFPKSHLDPFYERALPFLQIGNYLPADWIEADTQPLDFGGKRVTTTIVQFGPRDVFLRECRERLAASKNILVYLKLNCVEIEVGEDGRRVTRVRLVTLARKQYSVEAKTFVLAAGGIENARLLLLSNQTMKAGLGNQHDLVGRFFMDHYGLFAGMVFPAERAICDRLALYGLRRVNGTSGMGILCMTEETARRERLLNIATYLTPRPRTYHLRRKAAYSRRALKAWILNRPVPRKPERPRGPVENLRRCLLGYTGVASYRLLRKVLAARPFVHASRSAGVSRLPQGKPELSTIEIVQLFEQAPAPGNRVILSEERDRLGCRKAKVVRRLSALDVDSVRRSQEILREEFSRCDIGRFVIDDDFVTPEFTSVAHGASHHMGTTRMHDDPLHGVVDANCLVHGIENLYVAGSSVFPTGGHANPTLTIIAMALRLSDHLKTLI